MTDHLQEHQDETMTGLIRALEIVPSVDVPDNFTARVMARIPQKQSRVNLRYARALAPRYGRTMAFVSLGVLVAAMLLVTYFTGASGSWSALQFVLLLQLAAYVMWISFASWRAQ